MSGEDQLIPSDNIVDGMGTENPVGMDIEAITIENQSKSVNNVQKGVSGCEVRPRSDFHTRKTRERRCPASSRENNLQVKQLLKAVAEIVGKDNFKMRQLLKSVGDAFE